MFARLARFVVRHPWWTIGVWLVAAIAVIVFAPPLTTKSDQGDFLPSRYESVQAIKIAEKAFPQQEDISTLIVIRRSDGAPLTSTDIAKVGLVAQALDARRPPSVNAFVTGPQAVAPNRAVQIINVPMKGTSTKAQEQQGEAIAQIRGQLPRQLQGSGLEAKVGGEMAAYVDNEDSFAKSMQVVGIATIILIISLILLIFRAPIAAILPIVVIFFTYAAANGVIAWATDAFGLTADQSLQTIILIVLFGIGADYILFVLFRYRERLRAGDDPKTAITVATGRVGEVIASAAGAIVAAFLVLLLADFGGFGSLGPALAIAVALMAVTALTLVPAIVSLLGPAIFWPSKSWRKPPKAAISARLGRVIERRPAVTALISGCVMVMLALGTLGFKADYDFQAGYPQDTESAQAMKDLARGFPPGVTTPVQVIMQRTDGRPLTPEQLTAFGQAMRSAPGVGQVQQAVTGLDRSVARVDLFLTKNPMSNESVSLVRTDLRDAVHKAAPSGVRALVGGRTAIFADINEVNNRDLSVILPVAAVLIALILGLLLRSLIAPLYLVVAVLLGFAATIGSSVYVYQGILGKPGLTFQLPIIMYLFVLAIGTDYNILMVARLREEAKESNGPRSAAALAVEHGASTVASAGLILAGTFAVLTLAPVLFLQELGFGVAIGISLSAFVMATFLVPSITALLGRSAWWPANGGKPPGHRAPEVTGDRFVPAGLGG